MEVSVIIPTFNSKDRLAGCLESVLRQDFRRFEVIVVNDGSTDGTLAVAKKFDVKVFTKLRQGPAVARNFGAQKANGKILVFIDDDCIPEKGWLSEMAQPFDDPKVVGVQGAYRTKQKELCARFIQLEIEDRYDRIKNSKQMDWIGSYSAAYRRDAFFEAQGFDNSFPMASGEDPELSFKLSKKGHRLVFNSKAMVYHRHDTNFPDYFRKKFFRAYWRVLLYKRHSEKMVSDSYTPQTLKLQILLFYLFLLSPAAVIFFAGSDVNLLVATWASVFAAFFITTVPFAAKNFRKDREVALSSFAVFPLRSAFFGLGLLAGTLMGAWRK